MSILRVDLTWNDPYTFLGAHNDNEEEKGEGRSVSRPHERLKFQNFLTVVVLLSLDLDDASQRMHSVLALCTSIRPRSSSK